MKRNTTKYALRYQLFMRLGNRQMKKAERLSKRLDKAHIRQGRWDYKASQEFTKLYKKATN